MSKNATLKAGDPCPVCRSHIRLRGTFGAFLSCLYGHAWHRVFGEWKRTA